MPRPLSSLQKLNRMHQLFTVQDEGGKGKLNRGEVDAYASFYTGLSSSSQAKVRDRLIEIYQTSSYHRGQKDRFLAALEEAGFSIAELEGVPENSAEAFARMSPEAQFDRLQELENSWSEEGFTREITRSDIPPGARTAVERGIDEFKTDFEAEHTGGDIDEVIFEGELLQAIYLEEGSGSGQGLVGYTAEIGIYDGHDIDEKLYFNRKGEYLGSEYVGE